jgi:hypothetical protein
MFHQNESGVVRKLKLDVVVSDRAWPPLRRFTVP